MKVECVFVAYIGTQKLKTDFVQVNFKSFLEISGKAYIRMGQLAYIYTHYRY